MALVAVLWIISLLAILAAGIGSSGRTSAELAFSAVQKLKARVAADAGIHRAIFGLVTGDADRIWPQGGLIGYRVTWEDAHVDVEIRDEDGKIDLNAASQPLLRHLFEAVGASQATAAQLAERLIAYREGGDRLSAQAGDIGSRDDDEAGGLPLRSVEQLNHVFGMTPAVFQRLQPHITVHSAADGVDPSRASDTVLRALAALSADDGIEPLPSRPTQDPAWSDDMALPSRHLIFAIRTTGESGGGRFVREAIVTLEDGRHDFPATIQMWKQSR